MSKKKYIALIALIALLFLIALFIKQYVYGEHRDIATEKASVEISALELGSKFTTNQTLASKELLDKVITVSGKIISIEASSIVIDDKVQANLLHGTISNSSVGDKVTIKGRCIGYDDLLELVKIDQATQIIK